MSSFLERAKKISALLRGNTPASHQALKDLGFEWHDDADHESEEEEKKAIPLNTRQVTLVDYFEGKIPFNEELIYAFEEEKESENPNYPLFRRYFRRGNDRLKFLLLKGLEKNPCHLGFLMDLSFFHEHYPCLAELVRAYLNACGLEKDLEKFERLARDFYDNTSLHGVDAFTALEKETGISAEKQLMIQKLLHKFEKEEKESFEF